MPENFISIGKITKAIGLKGFLKVLILTDFPDRFKTLNSARLFKESGQRFLKDKSSGSEEFIIKEVIFERDFVKMQFEGYEDINLVSELTDSLILLEEKERMELEDGQFYFYELIGMKVFKSGQEIGKLESIENYGAQDIFKIRLKNNKEALIPYIDDFVKRIDIKERKIEIEVIDGMLN